MKQQERIRVYIFELSSLLKNTSLLKEGKDSR